MYFINKYFGCSSITASQCGIILLDNPMLVPHFVSLPFVLLNWPNENEQDHAIMRFNTNAICLYICMH